MNRFNPALILMCASFLAQGGNGEGRLRYPGDVDVDKPILNIVKPEFPAAPNPASLREIYVSAESTNAYYIDLATLTVGLDDVVRYVLVVETSGGTRNVNFEGIRCDNRASRLYAIGRPDGSWVKPRVSEWRPIENKPVNGYHAALTRDFFCPNGAVIRTAEEGQRALRLGKHSEAQ